MAFPSSSTRKIIFGVTKQSCTKETLFELEKLHSRKCFLDGLCV